MISPGARSGHAHAQEARTARACDGGRGRGRRLRHARDGEPNFEAGADPQFGHERQASGVLVDHDGARDGQSLPGAAPDLLGREERLEDARGDRRRHTRAVVADVDDYTVAVEEAPDADRAALTLGTESFADGVGGIHDQIQENLVQLSRIARNGRELAQVELHVGDVFYLVAGDGQSIRDAAIDVVTCDLALTGVSELAHGGYDLSHPSHPFVDTLECQLHVGPELGQLGLDPVPNRSSSSGAHRAPLHEASVVADELNGSIDLVCDSGCQLTDGA